MLIVAIGDTHIPGRAGEIPAEIVHAVEELSPDRILFTGDANEYSVLFFLDRIAPTYAVRGNTDTLDLPGVLSLDLGKKVLLMHGHQFGRGNYHALVNYASGHDILVCGHTHRQETFKERGVIVVNPGSATGVWSGGGGESQPSFTSLEIKKGEVDIWEYMLGGENGVQSKRAEIENKA